MELPIRKPRKSFTPEGVQFAWDSHSLQAAQKCARYYQYSILEGWRRNTEKEDLRFGRHFATALEHYYKLVAEDMDWEEALLQIVHETLIATWDYERDPDTDSLRPGTGQPWASTDSIKTRETLIRSIVWYVDQFHDEPVKVIKRADGTPMVEYSFALPADNGILLTGHIDRVVEYADSPYVMDQKTTKQTITPRWFDQFKPHTQFSMYTFAGKMIFDLPIKGVIIDGAQIAVGFTRFERSVSMRTDEELNEFYDHTMHWIEHYQKLTRENHFPMNPQSCGNYGGCEFRAVCSRTPGLRLNFLKAEFHQNDPWDPLEER